MAAKKKAKKKKAASGSKKKAARRTTSSARKSASKAKKTSRKKTLAKKKKTAKHSASAKRKTTKTAKKTAKKKAARKPHSLGRPRLPADAKLDLVFQKDYQAREIFAFLGVSTLRELEEFGPDEIIGRLTAPVVETVQRIRKALALNNRCLKNDRRFAREFQAAWKKGR